CGPLLASLDNLAGVRFPSRLVINPLLGPGREAYEFEPGTQLLLGHRYALVRPEIRRVRPARAQEPPLCQAGGKPTAGQFRALVALREDDFNGQALELARLMLNVPRVARVDVVVRPHHPHVEKFQALAAAHPERLEVALEPGEVTARIVRCHFAVTGGGGWSLELACVGVPQLVIVRTEAHRASAPRMEEEGG